MEVYRSTEARKTVRNLVRSHYGGCRVPVKSDTVHSEEFGETHVLSAGRLEAPPLLLLHGSSGNSTAWFGMVSGLAEEFRIHMVDIPGQPGLSSSRRPELTGETMSRWLSKVVGYLELDTFYLAGMSLGGWIALDYAIRNPSRVSGLVLISPSGIRPPRPGFLFRVLPLTLLGRFGQRRLFRLIHGPVPVHPDMLIFARIVADGYRPLTTAPALFRDGDLAGLAMPLLFLGGERDIMLDMPGSAKRLERLVSGSRILLRSEYGHVLPDESATITEFLLAV